MKTTEEISLAEVLNDCHVAELPAELTGSRIWLIAIVKVRKRNGKVNYAKVVNDGYGRAKIVKDYGTPSVIHSIEKIYPLEYLHNTSVPRFRDAETMASYLARKGEDSEYVKTLIGEKSPNKALNESAELSRLFYYHVINDCIKQSQGKYL